MKDKRFRLARAITLYPFGAICNALSTALLVAIAWLACAVACLMAASVAVRLACAANSPCR